MIWGIRHGDTTNRSLMAFNNSSSVAWSWTPKEKVAILAEFDSIDRQSYMGPPYHTMANQSFSVPAGASADSMYCGASSLYIDANGDCVTSGGDPVSAGVNRAIESGSVYTTAFHGILSSPRTEPSSSMSHPTTAVSSCAELSSTDGPPEIDPGSFTLSEHQQRTQLRGV